MPRTKRVTPGGMVFHALNRGVGKMRILAYCLMPNHWHTVLRRSEDGLLGRMLRWVTATHT